MGAVVIPAPFFNPCKHLTALMNYEPYVIEADCFEIGCFKRAVTREEQLKIVPHSSLLLPPYLQYNHKFKELERCHELP